MGPEEAAEDFQLPLDAPRLLPGGHDAAGTAVLQLEHRLSYQHGLVVYPEGAGQERPERERTTSLATTATELRSGRIFALGLTAEPFRRQTTSPISAPPLGSGDATSAAAS
jgi:hypothetical protein